MTAAASHARKHRMHAGEKCILHGEGCQVNFALLMLASSFVPL